MGGFAPGLLTAVTVAAEALTGTGLSALFFAVSAFMGCVMRLEGTSFFSSGTVIYPHGLPLASVRSAAAVIIRGQDYTCGNRLFDLELSCLIYSNDLIDHLVALVLGKALHLLVERLLFAGSRPATIC